MSMIKKLMTLCLITMSLFLAGCEDQPSTPTIWEYTNNSNMKFISYDDSSGHTKFFTRLPSDPKDSDSSLESFIVTIDAKGKKVSQVPNPLKIGQKYFLKNIIYVLHRDNKNIYVGGYNLDLQPLFSTTLKRKYNRLKYQVTDFGVIIKQGYNDHENTFINLNGDAIHTRIAKDPNDEFTWLTTVNDTIVVSEKRKKSPDVTHIINTANNTTTTLPFYSEAYAAGYLVSKERLASGDTKIRYHALDGSIQHESTVPTHVNSEVKSEITTHAIDNTLYSVFTEVKGKSGSITLFKHNADASIAWKHTKTYTDLPLNLSIDKSEIKLTSTNSNDIIFSYNIEGYESKSKGDGTTRRLTTSDYLHHLRFSASGELKRTIKEEYFFISSNIKPIYDGLPPNEYDALPPIRLSGMSYNYNVIPLADNGLMTLGEYYGPNPKKFPKTKFNRY